MSVKKIIEFNTLRGQWKMLKNDCDKCQNLEFSFEQLNEIPTLDSLNKSPLHVWFIRECVGFTTTFELMNQIPCRSTNNKIQVKQKIMSATFFSVSSFKTVIVFCWTQEISSRFLIGYFYHYFVMFMMSIFSALATFDTENSQTNMQNVVSVCIQIHATTLWICRLLSGVCCAIATMMWSCLCLFLLVVFCISSKHCNGMMFGRLRFYSMGISAVSQTTHRHNVDYTNDTKITQND